MFRTNTPVIALASLCLLAVSPLAPAENVMIAPSADGTQAWRQAMEGARMSLVPQSLPVPAELVLGMPEQDAADLQRQLLHPLVLPPAQETGFLEQVGRVIEAQDVPWPLGTVTTAHFNLPVAERTGGWIPFVSVLQDADEVDAHVRNGVGAGISYRIGADARVDVEAEYLESSGDVNPALSSEGRVNVLLSFSF